MFCQVFGTRHDFDVVPVVIQFVAIDMMDDLAGPQRSAEFTGRDKTMLISIPTNICHRVFGANLDQHIAI